MLSEDIHCIRHSGTCQKTAFRKSAGSLGANLTQNALPANLPRTARGTYLWFPNRNMAEAKCAIPKSLPLSGAAVFSQSASEAASIRLSGPDAPRRLLPDELLHVGPIDLAHINGALGIDRDGGGVIQSLDLLQDLAVFDARNE